jgi:hypothetical protein
MLMILFLIVDVPEFIIKGFKVYREGIRKIKRTKE